MTQSSSPTTERGAESLECAVDVLSRWERQEYTHRQVVDGTHERDRASVAHRRGHRLAEVTQSLLRLERRPRGGTAEAYEHGDEGSPLQRYAECASAGGRFGKRHRARDHAGETRAMRLTLERLAVPLDEP